MARGQHRIADLRRQLENRRDNERNQNWGHLLHPSYQRLRGHWERAWNCRGWPCYSPLVTIGNEVIFFYHGSTGMLWRTSLTRTSCWTQKIPVPWKIFLRSAVIKLTSRMNGWAKQTKSYVSSKLDLKCPISGLLLLLGEQRSRGATLLQPVWLPKSQPQLLRKVKSYDTKTIAQTSATFSSIMIRHIINLFLVRHYCYAYGQAIVDVRRQYLVKKNVCDSTEDKVRNFFL